MRFERLSSSGQITTPLLLLVAVLASCATPPWSQRVLSDGTPVTSLVGSDTSVVLIYDPEDCFTCYASLQPWLLWGKRNPESFALVFTRVPTPLEARRLQIYRIRASGYLAKPRPWDAPPTGPIELLVIGGEVRREEVVTRGQLSSQLYRSLTDSSRRPPLPLSSSGE